MGDLREPSVGATDEKPPSSPSNPSHSSIGDRRWARAEEATQKIICHVQPTAVSEERRREVIDYVQRLIRTYLGCEVFPFGSVPLKTYLPDGDIDLTAFGGASVEDALANDVVSVLEGEDQNRNAEFVVKDVQLIRAEVKLVKCIVQNIVVDISFNQLGGLCTLCFLEQVDRLIGKDHLFKRSIILIKAWCYYESRILGAHHGLISTYALETLVLYIFHLFHSALNGPLAVLYKFLDYFSKFDWDKYCISLNGPVHISSLPVIMAETPENGGSDLLLSDDFLRCCVETFSVPSRGADMNSRTFPQKHLNIVDPLKESNNLGRSVSKGNFYRIRSAFTYGARKLGRILLQPDDKIADELHKFFSNTLDRHGSGQRPDVQDPVSMSSHNGLGPAMSLSETETCQEEKTICETGEHTLDCECSSENDASNISASGLEMKISRTTSGDMNGQQRFSMKVVDSTMFPEAENSGDGTLVLGHRISGDAKDLATSRIRGLKISNDLPRFPAPSGEDSFSPLGVAHYAPHLYFSGSILDDRKMDFENSDLKEQDCCGLIVNKVSSGLLHVPDERRHIIVGGDQEKKQLVSNQVMTSAIPKDVLSTSSLINGVEDVLHGYRERTLGGSAAAHEYLNSLSDLCGDYDGHFNSLQYGRRCYEYAFTLPLPSPMPSQFQNKNLWDAVWHSSQFERNGFSHTNANGVIPRTAIYSMNTLLIPGAGGFGVEEMPKPRGTGTYFPNTNRPPYQKTTVRGRSQAPARSPRNNGRAGAPTEGNLFERGIRDQQPAQFHIDHGGWKSGSSEMHQSGSPGRKVSHNVNGHISPAAPLLESTRQPNPTSSLAQASSQSPLSPGMQRIKPMLGTNQDRVTAQSYHLKDEDDFPPLSV